MNRAMILISLGLLATPASSEILGFGKSTAEAVIIDTRGLPIGRVTAAQSKKNGLRIAVAVRGLSRGEHAIHIHEKGTCAGSGFNDAGGHWNPHGKMHGSNNPTGAHAGDLPNLFVGKNGRGKLKFDLPNDELWGKGGMMDDDGATFVIHAQSDDHRTDPSGNSGDRIACGVFVRK